MSQGIIDLRGKCAIVTGGSRGIGAATAVLLARSGANVGIAYRNRSEEADAVVKRIRDAGGTGWSVGAELGTPEGCAKLFERGDAEFGRLDIFVANAGIWPPEYVAIRDMSYEGWDEVLRANLTSVFLTVREAVRRMPSGGKIVIISSTAGQRGEAGHGHYAASKGAIISLVKSLAVELGPRDIQVNAVAPGWVDTEMAAPALLGEERDRVIAGIPLGRLATAGEIAGPIVFLCSDLARHVTGEVLNVNGGSVLCG